MVKNVPYIQLKFPLQNETFASCPFVIHPFSSSSRRDELDPLSLTFSGLKNPAPSASPFSNPDHLGLRWTLPVLLCLSGPKLHIVFQLQSAEN